MQRGVALVGKVGVLEDVWVVLDDALDEEQVVAVDGSL